MQKSEQVNKYANKDIAEVNKQFGIMLQEAIERRKQEMGEGWLGFKRSSNGK